VLLLAAGIVLGLYLVRRHSTERATARNALTIPQLGLTIQQSAHGVTIAKDSGGKPVFRVYAQRADKLRSSGTDELHNVRIVVYGSDGVHSDQIAGTEFAYDESTGEATAGGPVTIDAALDASSNTTAASGPLARPRASPAGQGSPMHIEALDLTLNVKTGVGTITKGLQFSYLNANGSAGQARVDSHAGLLTLGGQVRVTWKRSAQPDLVIRGERAELRRLTLGGPDAALLSLAGGATMASGETTASAGEFIFHWRADRTLRQLDALGQVHAAEAAAARRLTISADSARANFVAAGPHHAAVDHIALAGAVAIAELTPQQTTRLTAATAAFLFDSGHRLTQIQTQGDGASEARLLLTSRGRSQSVSGHELDFHLVPAATPETPRLASVDALSTATLPVQMALSGTAQSGPIEAQAARLHVTLDARQQPTLATANGDVRLRQTVPSTINSGSSSTRTSRSDALVLHFAEPPQGGPAPAGAAQLSGAVETGHVELRQADRLLQADAADYDVATSRVVLTAQPQSAYTHGVVHGADADTTFTAPRVVWTQSPHGGSQLLASGDISLSHAAPGKDASPVVITAQSLRWNQLPASTLVDRRPVPSAPPLATADGFVPALTGTGVFTGGVRLVQAPNLLRADSVTVDGAQRTLTASGHVETVFLPATGANENAPMTTMAAATTAATAVPLNPHTPVTITAATLRYQQLAGRADYQGHVQLHADGAELSAPQLEVGLSPQAQLTTARARGGVRITQPGRTLTAQQANFDFATRGGQLTGGPPSILDAEQGRISGDPLTFSLSSDEIQVGSKSGARASGQTTIRPR
jgi:lipopolysaccharide export system protein LptA